jgi:hypothetical protein
MEHGKESYKLKKENHIAQVNKTLDEYLPFYKSTGDITPDVEVIIVADTNFYSIVDPKTRKIRETAPNDPSGIVGLIYLHQSGQGKEPFVFARGNAIRQMEQLRKEEKISLEKCIFLQEKEA